MHSPLPAVLWDGAGPCSLQEPRPSEHFPLLEHPCVFQLGSTPTCPSLLMGSPPHVFYEARGGAKAPVRPDADATPVVVEEDSQGSSDSSAFTPQLAQGRAASAASWGSRPCSVPTLLAELHRVRL